jgi:hypothetical protein
VSAVELAAEVGPAEQADLRAARLELDPGRQQVAQRPLDSAPAAHPKSGQSARGGFWQLSQRAGILAYPLAALGVEPQSLPQRPQEPEEHSGNRAELPFAVQLESRLQRPP